MRIGKSLLLGSAAGIAAVTGAQAADLPVKAKPVEYVKVCSLYGAGFFYIPGTDKCIKIGGYLREQYDIHGAGDGLAYMDTTNGDVDAGQHQRLIVPDPFGDLRRRARAIVVRHDPRLHGIRRPADDSERRQLGAVLHPQLRAVRGLHDRPCGVVLRLLQHRPVCLAVEHPLQPRQHRRHRHRRVCLHGATRQWPVGHAVG